MANIQGITVILFDKVSDGVDEFNQPTYTETEIEVENVLIEPVSTTQSADTTDIKQTGIQYRLHIPKTDTNTWTNRKVKFYDSVFKTVGAPMVYMEELTPLEWNKKVLVEKYE